MVEHLALASSGERLGMAETDNGGPSAPVLADCPRLLPLPETARTASASILVLVTFDANIYMIGINRGKARTGGKARLGGL
jgi:hypothetical protein